MRDSHASADPRRSQSFPLQERRDDQIGGETAAGSGFGREFLQQRALVRGPDVDDDIGS